MYAYHLKSMTTKDSQTLEVTGTSRWKATESEANHFLDISPPLLVHTPVFMSLLFLSSEENSLLLLYYQESIGFLGALDFSCPQFQVHRETAQEKILTYSAWAMFTTDPDILPGRKNHTVWISARYLKFGGWKANLRKSHPYCWPIQYLCVN